MSFDFGALLDQLSFAWQKNRAVKIALGWPVIERRGVIMADKTMVLGTTRWVPIHTVNAEGAIVPAPSGDTFSATSSDAVNLVAGIDVMPAGTPLAGAVAMKLVSPLSGSVVTGVSVTVSDSASLKSETDLVDVVADVTPKAVSLDWGNAVDQPSA